MSRERRQRRDARRMAGFEFYTRMVKKFAKAERRTLNSPSEAVAYVEELVERGLIVDMGPHPSGVGRRISFRLDKVPALQESSSFSWIEDLIPKGIQ